MTDGARLWLKIGLGTACAAALLVLVAPERPPARMPWWAALVFGLAGGVVLFGLVARRPPLLARARSWPTFAGTVVFFGLWAANEEVVWRRIVLGELLAIGVAPALAVSTAGFALVHRGRVVQHVGTGLAFGAVYVVTGALAASVTAHWTYNLLVNGLVQRARGPGP